MHRARSRACVPTRWRMRLRKSPSASFLRPGDPRHLATTLYSLSILPSEALEIIHCFDGQAARDVKNRLAGPGGGGISIVQIAPGDMAVFLRAAIAAAHNDFVILLEPGDVVTPEALYARPIHHFADMRCRLRG